MGVLPVAVRPFGSTSPRLEPLGNGSLLLSSSSSSTTTLSSSSSTYSNVGFTDNVAFLIPLGIALSTLSLLTFFGNAMVVHAIRTERKLHTVSNMFILSLAIADLIVGLLVMPLSSTYVIFGDWILGLFVCQLWLVIDYTASTASILNLLILSLDRYWSIRSPLKYLCKRTKKRALAMIGIVWMISALWAIPIIGWHLWYSDGIRKHPNNVCETEFSDSVAFKLTTSIANFIVPMTLMVILYYKIYREIKRRGNFSDMNHHIVGRGYSTNTTANCPNKNCINKKNRNKCAKRNNTLTGFEHHHHYHQYAGHRNPPSLSPSENSSSGRHLSFKKPIPSPSPLSFTDNNRIKQQQLQQSTVTTTMDSNKNSLKYSTTTTTTQTMTRNQTPKSVLRRLMKSFLMKNISFLDDSNDKKIKMNNIQKSQNSNNNNKEFSVIECSSSLFNDDNDDVVTIVCPKPIVSNYHHSHHHHHHHHQKKKNKIQQELDSNSLMAVVTDDYDFDDDDDVDDISNDIVSRSNHHHQPNRRDSLEFKDSKNNSPEEEEEEINDDDKNDDDDDDDDEITNISPPTLRDLKLEHLSHDNGHRIRNSEHLFASFGCSSKSINNNNQNNGSGDDRKKFFRDQIFQSISLLSSSSPSTISSSTATLKNCDNNINSNNNKTISGNGDDNVETTTESIGIMKSISGKKRLRPPSIFSSLSSSSSASSTSSSISRNSSITSTTNPNAPSASCHSSTLSFGSFNNYKKNDKKTIFIDSDYCDENNENSNAKKNILLNNQNSDDHYHHDFDDNNVDEQFKCDNLVNSDNAVVVADDNDNDDDDSVNYKNIAYYTQLTLMSLQHPKTGDSNNNNNNHDNKAMNLDDKNYHRHISDADSVRKQGQIDDDVDNDGEQLKAIPGSVSLKKLSTSSSLNKIKLLDSKFKLTTNHHYSGINVKVEYIDSNNIIKTATINNSCTTTTTTTTMASIIIKNDNHNDIVATNNEKKRSKSMNDVVTESNHHHTRNQHDRLDKLKCRSPSLISSKQQKPKRSKTNLNEKCSKENNSQNKKKRKIQKTTDSFNHSHGNEKQIYCSLDYDHADDDDQTVDKTRQTDASIVTELDSEKFLDNHDNNNTNDNHKKIIDEITINSSFSSQTKTINTTTMAMASIVNPTEYHHNHLRQQQQQQKHCLTGTTTKTTNRIEKQQQQKLLQNVKHRKENNQDKTAEIMSLSNSLDATVTSTANAYGCDRTVDSIETQKGTKSSGINSNQTFTSTITTATTTMTMMETERILNDVPMHWKKSTSTSSSSSPLSLELPSKPISLSPKAKNTLALNNNEEEIESIDQFSNHDSIQTTTKVMNLNQDSKLNVSKNRKQTKNDSKKQNLFSKFGRKKASELGSYFNKNNVPITATRITMSKVQMDSDNNNKKDDYNSEISMLKPTKKTQNKMKKNNSKNDNNNKVKTFEQPHHNHHQNCRGSKNHSFRFKTFNFSLNRNDNANNNNKNNNNLSNNNNMIPMMSVNDSTTTVSKSMIEQQQQKQCHCMTSMSAAALHRNELKRVESSRLRQEKKAARQLGVILGAFILCWMPYIITYVVTAYCTYCISLTVHQVTIWLGYLNSFLNPFLYALCNENFKYAFKKMLGRLQQPQHYSNNFDQTLAANTNAGNSFNYGTNPSQKQKRKAFRMTTNLANDSIVVGTTTKTATVMSPGSILGNNNNINNNNNQYNRNSKKAIVSVSPSFTEEPTATNMRTDESNSSLQQQPKLTTITTRAAINKIE